VLDWAKFDIRLGWTIPLKCLCLLCKFEVLNLDGPMSLFVFVSPLQSGINATPSSHAVVGLGYAKHCMDPCNAWMAFPTRVYHHHSK
jgi:hypothetical protein